MRRGRLRVIVGPGCWHATDDEDNALMAATRCRVRGKQLQLTTDAAELPEGKRMCKRCARILGWPDTARPTIPPSGHVTVVSW